MSKKMIIKLGIIILFVGALGIGIYQLSLQKVQKNTVGLAELVQVEYRDLSKTVDGDGEVVFSKNGGIYPAYSSTVQKIHCQAGSRVKQGDLLMILTSDTLKTEWVEAEYSFNTAKLNKTLAEKNLKRLQTLYEAQGITIDELESAQNDYELAKVSLDSAKSELDLLSETTDSANYVGDDHRTIMIRAPFDGEVAWVQVKLGQTVSALGSNSSDSSSENLLLYLIADNSLEVEATIDETDVNNVKPGQTAKVILNDAEQNELTGTVTQVGAYGTDDSGVIVFPVRIKLNPSEVIIRPQMTADVSIYITSATNVLAVPRSAVLEEAGKTMVKQVGGAETRLVEVELGVSNASYVQIKSGLSEGDNIMLNPKNQEGQVAPSSKTNNSKSKEKNRRPAGPLPM